MLHLPPSWRKGEVLKTVDHNFLPGTLTNTQSNLDSIARWTIDNNMLLSPSKCSYMLFSRNKEQFITRLTVNNNKIDQTHVAKILGCWMDENPGKWQTNTKGLCKSAYSRMSMLSKLRYVGVSIEDLIEIYTLFIWSRAEYLSLTNLNYSEFSSFHKVYHSSIVKSLLTN